MWGGGGARGRGGRGDGCCGYLGDAHKGGFYNYGIALPVPSGAQFIFRWRIIAEINSSMYNTTTLFCCVLCRIGNARGAAAAACMFPNPTQALESSLARVEHRMVGVEGVVGVGAGGGLAQAVAERLDEVAASHVGVAGGMCEVKKGWRVWLTDARPC